MKRTLGESSQLNADAVVSAVKRCLLLPFEVNVITTTISCLSF